MKKNNLLIFTIFCGINLLTIAANAQETMHEQYRPQIHFSPKEHWVNDPNGMVYYKGIYHLFFQYYPGATVWGPMHWGHATSKDLVHWEQKPTALYPDSLGYIFSGSAVVDVNNTSGFGKNGKAPLVAIFTNHDPKGEKAKRNDFQNQSIAYSLDEGNTWTKYAGNPVLKNPGIIDFRDPKVMWYEAGKKWVMTLATKDRVTFYSSPNLKVWKKESDFGATLGAHGGVWECPDLFPLNYNGKKVWVLIASINPGGPNGGSATQYFLGDFDGHSFTPNSNKTKWIDYGPDDYAGITWSNTGDRKIFIGWMSNWDYADRVPTVKWRSAMTVPRELKIKEVGNDMFVASEPVKELGIIARKPEIIQQLTVNGNYELFPKTVKKTPSRLDISLDKTQDFSILLSNSQNEKLVIGFDKTSNSYFIDRSTAGKSDFKEGFARKHTAPRLSNNPYTDISIILDESSMELFADDGLTVMTEIFFPQKPFDKLEIKTKEKVLFKKIRYSQLKSIWP
jgi:fructan beta-fructosidase